MSWEVTDQPESGGRASRAIYDDEDGAAWLAALCLTSPSFPWEFVSAEPGRLVLRRNSFLREFKRLPDGSGKGK